MTVTNIISSNIQTVEYNEDINTLIVEFKSGAKYAYSNVPKEVFNRMITASSVGSYLNENIRNRYTYIRLS